MNFKDEHNNQAVEVAVGVYFGPSGPKGGIRVALPPAPTDAPWSANKVRENSVTRHQVLILGAQEQRKLFEESRIKFPTGGTLFATEESAELFEGN